LMNSSSSATDSKYLHTLFSGLLKGHADEI
jgi:hypothetical protein